MEWKSLAPWNWFKKEQESSRQPTLVDRRGADPWSALRDEMDRMIEEAFSRFGAEVPGTSLSSGRGVLLRPKLDISEKRKLYRVRVEIPGVDKGDVSVEVDGDALVIRGEKRRESDEGDESYHCVERSYGAFERVLALPEDADPAGIEAGFRRGVLEVRIPKQTLEGRESRRIEVQHE